MISWEDVKATLMTEGFIFKEIFDDDNEDGVTVDHSYLVRGREVNGVGFENITITVPKKVKTRNGETVLACWVFLQSKVLDRDKELDIEYIDTHDVDYYERYVSLDKLIDWVHNPLGF